MKIEIDAMLDDLLAKWHDWQSGYRHARGFSGSDATCRDYSSPKHWDWQNGAEEERALALEMKAFDKAIHRVPNTPHLWYTCLAFDAKNLASQATVWNSERLPKGEELAVLRTEARTRLLQELHRDGLLTA